MSVWFTSDLHLGHRFVAGLRGFATSADHDERIADEWASAVRKEDTVWVLGDLALGGLDAALALVASLPGRKHLVAGNHDACHPMHRRAHVAQRRYLAAFDSVQAFARRRVNGVEVLLSHFPYAEDHAEAPRYSQYRLRDKGRWLLHGHTHSDHITTGPREVHVGVDAWNLRPVPESALSGLIGDSA